MNLTVFGTGDLAERLRTHVRAEVPSSIIVPTIDGAGAAVAVHELDDHQIDSMFEKPMQAVIQSLQEAFRAGSQRLVVVVPTTAMSGGSHFAAIAALAEASRVLVKSAARQWGQNKVTVNAVSVEPRWFGIDPAIAGPVSIAVPALLDAAALKQLPSNWTSQELPEELSALDPVPLVTWLCSSAARTTTGQTFVCDGGQWM